MGSPVGSSRVTQAVDAALAGEWAEALIHGRRTVLPKRLAQPGPDAE
jgi:hypothetical protein